jgi:hypothetical protein
MATPMVAGLVADLLQIHPNWIPNQVKGDLTSRSVAENSSFQEPNATKAALLWNPPAADQGLTPNHLINAPSGNINYGLSSWRMSSWSRAAGPLNAGFAMSSWRCMNCTATPSPTATPGMSSWSMSSWSTEPLG